MKRVIIGYLSATLLGLLSVDRVDSYISQFPLWLSRATETMAQPYCHLIFISYFKSGKCSICAIIHLGRMGNIHTVSNTGIQTRLSTSAVIVYVICTTENDSNFKYIFFSSVHIQKKERGK